MAVMTYTVDMTGTSASITPDPTTIVQTDQDYMIFQRAVGLTTDIKIKIIGGAIDGQVIIAVRGTASRIQVNQPTLDTDGSILITVTDAAAASASGGVGGTFGAGVASGAIGFPP